MKRSRDYTAHVSAMPMQSLNEVFYQLACTGETGTATLAALRYVDQSLQELITTHVMARAAHGNRLAWLAEDPSKLSEMKRYRLDDLSSTQEAVTRHAMTADPPLPPLLRAEQRKHAAWFAMFCSANWRTSEVDVAALETLAGEHAPPLDCGVAVHSLSSDVLRQPETFSFVVRALRRAVRSGDLWLMNAVFSDLLKNLSVFPRDHPLGPEAVRLVASIAGSLHCGYSVQSLAKHFGAIAVLYDKLPPLLAAAAAAAAAAADAADSTLHSSNWSSLVDFLALYAPNESAARLICDHAEQNLVRTSIATACALLRFDSCRALLQPVFAANDLESYVPLMLRFVDDGDAAAVKKLLRKAAPQNSWATVFHALGTARVANVLRVARDLLVAAKKAKHGESDELAAFFSAVATHGTPADCQALASAMKEKVDDRLMFDLITSNDDLRSLPCFRDLAVAAGLRLLKAGDRSKLSTICRCNGADEAAAVLLEALGDPARAAFGLCGFNEMVGVSPEVVAKHADAICSTAETVDVGGFGSKQLCFLFRCLLKSNLVSDDTKVRLMSTQIFLFTIRSGEVLSRVDVLQLLSVRCLCVLLGIKHLTPNNRLDIVTELAMRADGAAVVLREYRAIVMELAAKEIKVSRLLLALAINSGNEGLLLLKTLISNVKSDDDHFGMLRKVLE